MIYPLPAFTLLRPDAGTRPVLLELLAHASQGLPIPTAITVGWNREVRIHAGDEAAAQAWGVWLTQAGADSWAASGTDHDSYRHHEQTGQLTLRPAEADAEVWTVNVFWLEPVPEPEPIQAEAVAA